MQKMESSVKITLIIAGAVIALALIGIYSFFQLLPTQTVNANGIATIKAVPDLVSVYFNVETNATTAQEAKDENAEISDNIITALIKQGFERSDIVTENFNLYPEYNYEDGKQNLERYKVSHSLKVQFSTDKTEKIGSVIDAGVDAGASIGYINFELSQEKQNEYKAQALKQAAEDAKIKAESIAEGLGKSIGSIYSISSSDFDYYPWRIYEATASSEAGVAEAKQAATDIQPGEKDITARVSVVFKLK